MSVRTIHTEKAPAAIGPYSQATVSGGFLFTAGQIALDPATGEIVAGDVVAQAERTIEYLESIGLGDTPVCMAKTQYSLTDDATRLGRPRDFRITVNELYPAAGAGFVVAQAGDIMTMPGLPKEPAAQRMAIHSDGSIVGLF